MLDVYCNTMISLYTCLEREEKAKDFIISQVKYLNN